MILVEIALIAGVLAPVAWRLRGRPRLVLGLLLVPALAAQLWLGSRLFPFVDWTMYSSRPSGDPVVLEYDVLLRGGGRDALVPGRYLGPESADRFMEALRREVSGGRREVASRALLVLAGMYEGGRVEAVVVSSRRVRLDGGVREDARELWRVPVP